MNSWTAFLWNIAVFGLLILAVLVFVIRFYGIEWLKHVWYHNLEDRDRDKSKDNVKNDFHDGPGTLA
jgi:hypothetical protein